jgi:hypothetical protein
MRWLSNNQDQFYRNTPKWGVFYGKNKLTANISRKYQYG